VKTWILYLWDNGAWISGLHCSFEKDMAELMAQYGPPTSVRPTAFQPKFYDPTQPARRSR